MSEYLEAPVGATSSKVKDLDDLAAICRDLKARGKKIVLSHGVFDLLHVGHIRHFQQARQMGDVLIVTLTQDHLVNKGPHRPAFPQGLRAESVAALGAVDFVAINRWPRSVETIHLLEPDVYAKGPDYKVTEDDITGAIQEEADAVGRVGGEIRFTDDVTFSSSKLLNQHFPSFAKATMDYLDGFRRRYSADEVLGWLDRARKARPLVVGEAIVDEYQFCTAIGKSTKDPVLAVLQERIEPIGGGTLAIANHLAGLCQEVGLITQLGETERYDEFVRGSLRSNIRPIILTKSGCPTVRKRRIVDRYFGNKLLEIYIMNDRPTDGDDARLLCDTLSSELPSWDLTVVADYGHGMLPKSAIDVLCDRSPFLCLNVQSNAGNLGYSTVSKYRSASYICLASHEIHLELRDRELDMKGAVAEILRRVDCPQLTVTLGKSGSLHFDRATGFVEAPALATKIQDRVGAGDAVLALTSLLAFVGAPWDITAFLGNVAGAELVAELGSRVPLEHVVLSKHVISLLK